MHSAIVKSQVKILLFGVNCIPTLVCWSREKREERYEANQLCNLGTTCKSKYFSLARGGIKVDRCVKISAH